jgi:hypothetical protein
MADFLAEAQEPSKGKPGSRARASIYYEAEGVRPLRLAFFIKIVLNFFGTVSVRLRIRKDR